MRAFRGKIVHFVDNPAHAGEKAYEYFDDGLLVVENDGKIKSIGNFFDTENELPDNVRYTDYSNYLLCPGFIDSHIHYPQLEMIASYSGGQLLDWLEKCVFSTERKYHDYEYSAKMSENFLRTLLKNGTTSALVFTSVHKASAQAFFEEAEKMDMLMIAGKILMDRNAPEYLLDTPQSAYDDSDELIKLWHNKKRLKYAITPRFAPTSTEAQLEVVSALKQKHNSVYIQTHLSENKNEIKWVKELYPWSRDYTDVYEKFGMLGDLSVFAHCAHLTEREFDAIKSSKSAIAWCPCSNFFLGSGLFNINRARKDNIRLSLASDVGGGNHIFMLQVMDEAYKVGAVQNCNISPLETFYQSTLGNAKAMSIDDKVGNLQPGKNADFLVINPYATPFLEHRTKHAPTIEGKIFCLQMLADKRIIKATYVNGVKRYENNSMIKEAFF